jgi:hypothetical protein
MLNKSQKLQYPLATGQVGICAISAMWASLVTVFRQFAVVRKVLFHRVQEFFILNCFLLFIPENNTHNPISAKVKRRFIFRPISVGDGASFLDAHFRPEILGSLSLESLVFLE